MGARDPVIVGVADAPLENGMVSGGQTPLEIQARAAKEALDSAGLSLADVDGLLTAGLWGIPGSGSLMPLTLGEYLGIQPSSSMAPRSAGRPLRPMWRTPPWPLPPDIARWP